MNTEEQRLALKHQAHVLRTRLAVLRGRQQAGSLTRFQAGLALKMGVELTRIKKELGASAGPIAKEFPRQQNISLYDKIAKREQEARENS